MEENIGTGSGEDTNSNNSTNTGASAPSSGGSNFNPGEIRKRNIAYKMRIGDILKGRPTNTPEGKFMYLEMGDRHVVRINVLANCVDKFNSEGEKKYLSITVDDASGQIRLKVFGDEVENFKDVNAGDTLQIIGNVREWNGEVYMIPEVIKKVDPRWLLVRKLEIQNSRRNMPQAENGSNDLKNSVMDKIKNAEVDGGIDTEALKMDTEANPELIDKEIKTLLEEGLIYEPRPGRLRYLG
ncbi:MAG: OB-fold nucleic acid binding domain-containing protein [Nanoarchaeota archaeon]|nr:OB-fold nucleic acid binding domain-containing protein [Nanoarchaeota archaeon]